MSKKNKTESEQHSQNQDSQDLMMNRITKNTDVETSRKSSNPVNHGSDKFPPHWEVKKLGEVCLVIAGQSPEGKYYNSDGNGIPFYQGKKEFGEKFIKGPKIWTTKTTKIAMEKDILLSIRAPVGPVNFATDQICIGRGLAAIRATKFIENEFLFNFFLNYKEKIVETEGSVFNSINKSQIDNIPIPLPPLSEQKEIVRILDKCFEAIDKAKANTEQNLKNAKELFNSYLNNIFTNKGEDWEVKKLGEVCEFVRGPFGGSLKKDVFQNDGYAVYEQQHAIYNQFYQIRYFIDERKFNEMRRFELLSGDLIMSCSGTMGKIAVVPSEIKKGIINQALLKLTPSNQIYTQFLQFFIQSQSFQDSLKSYSGGAAIQNVASVSILKQIPIPLPLLSEQQKIVKKLDAIREETKRLEAIYEKKLVDLEEMKKSILQKAFTGQLTIEEVKG